MIQLNARVAFVAFQFGPSGLGVSSAANQLFESLPQEFQAGRISINRPHTPPECTHVTQHWWQRPLREPAQFLESCLSTKANIVHIHGIWHGGIRHIERLQRAGIHTVVSIHGMLDPSVLAITPWRKALVTAWYQRRMLRQADAIHALNEREAEQIRGYLGESSPPIVVIPNGVKLPDPPGGDTPHPQRIFLTCCQFIPRKGLVELLDCWNASGLAHEAQLHVAGDGHGPYADHIKERLAREAGVRYLGFLNGPARDAAYRACDVVVLATKGEGMPMGILEGLSFGRPCVVTPAANLPAIASGQLGWMAEPGAPFTAALIAAARMPADAFAACAQRCRSYIAREHGDALIAQRFCALYDSILSSRPLKA